MDVIEGLPKSQGFDTILVVVNKLTKYGQFVDLKHPFTAHSVAMIFSSRWLDFMVSSHHSHKQGQNLYEPSLERTLQAARHSRAKKYFSSPTI